MMLFNPSTLRIAMYKMPEQTKRLGRRLSMPGSAQSVPTMKAFEKACEECDVEQVNQMLDNAICEYLGASDGVINALTSYCAKFGIHVDLFGKSWLDRLHTVASYRKEIRTRLEQEGL